MSATASIWERVAALPRPIATGNGRSAQAIRAARLRYRRRKSQPARVGAFAAYGGEAWGYHRDSHGVIEAGRDRFPLRCTAPRRTRVLSA